MIASEKFTQTIQKYQQIIMFHTPIFSNYFIKNSTTLYIFIYTLDRILEQVEHRNRQDNM